MPVMQQSSSPSQMMLLYGDIKRASIIIWHTQLRGDKIYNVISIIWVFARFVVK